MSYVCVCQRSVPSLSLSLICSVIVLILILIYTYYTVVYHV